MSATRITVAARGASAEFTVLERGALVVLDGGSVIALPASIVGDVIGDAWRRDTAVVLDLPDDVLARKAAAGIAATTAAHDEQRLAGRLLQRIAKALSASIRALEPRRGGGWMGV